MFTVIPPYKVPDPGELLDVRVCMIINPGNFVVNALSCVNISSVRKSVSSNNYILFIVTTRLLREGVGENGKRNERILYQREASNRRR